MSTGAKVVIAVVALLLGGLFFYEGARRLGDSRAPGPDFTATTLQGAQFRLSERLERGPVLLSFFSTT
ncbi:MAG: hypothetical protein ACK47B_11520 [Armatimonadota bacterium]